MAVKKKKSSSTSKIKKKWYNIISPRYMGESTIGATLLGEMEHAIGKNIVVNLMNITGNGKHQNVNLTFNIVNVKENNLYTQIVKYNILPTSVKRLVRRDKDRIDDSFVIKTKDGVTLRIKPVLLTRGNTNKSVRMLIRKQCRRYVLKKANIQNYDVFIKEIIEFRFQREMKDTLKKAYPLGIADVRSCAIVKGDVALTAVPEEPPAEEVKEEKPAAEEKPETVEKPVKEDKSETVEKKPVEEKPVKEPAKDEAVKPAKKVVKKVKKDAKADS